MLLFFDNKLIIIIILFSFEIIYIIIKNFERFLKINQYRLKFFFALANFFIFVSKYHEYFNDFIFSFEIDSLIRYKIFMTQYKTLLTRNINRRLR